jgi:hypothetical protein
LPRSWLRRVLSNQTVDGLAEEVGVADVAGVLVVQIDQHPPEVGGLTGLGGEP